MLYLGMTIQSTGSRNGFFILRFRLICLGGPTSMFATHLNYQLETIVSFPHLETQMVYTMSISWKGVIGYVFPLFALPQHVLQKVWD